MKKIILGMALAATMCAAAELKVGTVNMLDLVRLHPNHESNKALVKSTDSDFKSKLEKMQEEGKAIAEEGKKLQADLMNPMLSASAKSDAQKKMDDVQRRFLAAQQDLRNAAQHFQSDLADPARIAEIFSRIDYTTFPDGIQSFFQKHPSRQFAH